MILKAQHHRTLAHPPYNFREWNFRLAHNNENQAHSCVYHILDRPFVLLYHMLGSSFVP